MNRPQDTAAVLPEIFIPASEYERLLELAEVAARNLPQVAHYLQRELARAQVVPDDQFKVGAARIGSQVTFRDDLSGKQRMVGLVWPHEADVAKDRISVLSSVGAALLGMRCGQSIDWPAPLGGSRSLTVVAVNNPMAPGPVAA